jgi:hypothetical protein
MRIVSHGERKRVMNELVFLTSSCFTVEIDYYSTCGNDAKHLMV